MYQVEEQQDLSYDSKDESFPTGPVCDGIDTGYRFLKITRIDGNTLVAFARIYELIDIAAEQNEEDEEEDAICFWLWRPVSPHYRVRWNNNETKPYLSGWVVFFTEEIEIKFNDADVTIMY